MPTIPSVKHANASILASEGSVMPQFASFPAGLCGVIRGGSEGSLAHGALHITPQHANSELTWALWDRAQAALWHYFIN